MDVLNEIQGTALEDIKKDAYGIAEQSTPMTPLTKPQKQEIIEM